MIWQIVELAFTVAGVAAGAVLFRRDPLIPPGGGTRDLPDVSVVIPARNEAANLPLLLRDLMAQTVRPREILVIDDDSEDDTCGIAGGFPVRVAELKDKPAGWLGKTWACHQGAGLAKGQWLLFLDADVRLAPGGLARLFEAAATDGRAITVQPYHNTELPHEQLALIFNLLHLGATGAAMVPPKNLGMFGPVILIPAADYWAAGGHESVRSSLAEDVALGRSLQAAGISYRMYRGDEAIAFRMYAGGLRSLVQGWTKNLASGAQRIPPGLFLLVFLWIASMSSAPLEIIRYGILGQDQLVALYGLFYLLWVAFLLVWARRLGSFRLWAILCYPVPLILFIFVFLRSLAKKLLGRPVVWKGRSIDPRRSS